MHSPLVDGKTTHDRWRTGDRPAITPIRSAAGDHRLPA
jgi:hypothetical protein